MLRDVLPRRGQATRDARWLESLARVQRDGRSVSVGNIEQHPLETVCPSPCDDRVHKLTRNATAAL